MMLQLGVASVLVAAYPIPSFRVRRQQCLAEVLQRDLFKIQIFLANAPICR